MSITQKLQLPFTEFLYWTRSFDTSVLSSVILSITLRGMHDGLHFTDRKTEV